MGFPKQISLWFTCHTKNGEKIWKRLLLNFLQNIRRKQPSLEKELSESKFIKIK